MEGNDADVDRRARVEGKLLTTHCAVKPAKAVRRAKGMRATKQREGS